MTTRAPHGIFDCETVAVACKSYSSPATSGTTLPRNAIVPLSEVSRFFPDITRQTSRSRNLTVTGNPKATGMVIYETSDGSKKVTITVDRYRSSSEASSTYQQAVQKSQSVPGFKPGSRYPLWANRLSPGPRPWARRHTSASVRWTTMAHVRHLPGPPMTFVNMRELGGT